MRLDNDMLGFFATHIMELDQIVDELALAGYPECNASWVQERAAKCLDYQSADDMYERLTDDDVEYIKRELRKRFI